MAEEKADDGVMGLLPTRKERHRLHAASLAVSIAVGFGSFLIKADLPQSILLGVVTMLAFLVVESTSTAVSLGRLVGTMDSQLKEVISRLQINEKFAESWEHLHRSGPSGVQLAQTVERMSCLLRETPAPLFGLFNESLSEPVSALERQELLHAGQDPALGTKLISWFQYSLFATSLHPLQFWFTPWGQNYHRAICDRTRELARSTRKAPLVRRVFIVSTDSVSSLKEGPYRKLIREQIDAGVDVRICYESDLHSELRVDFGIWDERLEAFLIPDESKRISKVYYRYSSEAVRAASHRASLIWDRSVPFDTWLSFSAASQH